MDYRSIFESDFDIQKIKYTGNQGLGCCPLPSHDDRKPSFSFNISTGQCKCFGCSWEGNAYLLAKEMNMDNPHQYIESSTMDSKKHRTNGYEPNNALKSENKQVIDVDRWLNG